MKDSIKNNLKITVMTTAGILLIIAFFVYIAFYGNPIEKNKAQKEITAYIQSNYPQYSQKAKAEYNASNGNYTAEIKTENKIYILEYNGQSGVTEREK